MIHKFRPYVVGFYFLFMIAGLFYPWLGFAVLICMVAPILVALVKGRFWCGNFCPRGSFFDVVMSKFSPRKAVPHLLTTKIFKVAVIIGMMGIFASQVFIHWGNPEVIGAFLIRMLIITSLIGFVLGMVYHQRTWCSFCPMGTLATLTSKVTNSSKMIIDRSCVGCKACQKVCPIGLDPSSGKESGFFEDSNCMKCGQCEVICPKQAIHL